jgi:hypothetical protein
MMKVAPATGGTARLLTDGSTVSVTGSVFVTAAATAGGSFLATGGAATGGTAEFVDGAAGIARRVANLLGPRTGPPGPSRAIFTQRTPHVDALAPALKGFGLDTVEIV